MVRLPVHYVYRIHFHSDGIFERHDSCPMEHNGTTCLADLHWTIYCLAGIYNS